MAAGQALLPLRQDQGINEIQCGSYAFMDADYGRIENETGQRFDQAEWQNALFLLTSIVSTYKMARPYAMPG